MPARSQDIDQPRVALTRTLGEERLSVSHARLRPTVHPPSRLADHLPVSLWKYAKLSVGRLGAMTVTAKPATGMPAPAGSLSDVTRSESALRTFLHGLPGEAQVGADARASMLGTRSIKTSAKQWAIDLAIRMVDLTTLEGADTPGKVKALCAKARRPDPTDTTCPAVAAVCVYPSMVATAAAELRDS